MVSKVVSATPYDFHGQLIEIEGDISRGLPGLQIVGLGNKAIDESRDRVRSAIKNSLLDFPKGKITINLAPAELPKDGTQFDLPIALAILCLGKQLPQTALGGRYLLVNWHLMVVFAPFARPSPSPKPPNNTVSQPYTYRPPTANKPCSSPTLLLSPSII